MAGAGRPVLQHGRAAQLPDLARRQSDVQCIASESSQLCARTAAHVLCILSKCRQTCCKHLTNARCLLQVLVQSQYLRWRESSFLHNPRTPRAVVWSETSLWHLFPHAPVPASYATGAHVHASNEAELRRAAAGTQSRVLRIQNMQPGMFSGFESASWNQEFNRWFERMMHDMKWCCTTQISELKQQRYDSLDFPLPVPLSTEEPPRFHVRTGHSLWVPPTCGGCPA
jgi:hypothetical protein